MATTDRDTPKHANYRTFLFKLRKVFGKRSVHDICRPSAPCSTVILSKSVICAFDSVISFLSGMCDIEEIKIETCLTMRGNKGIAPMGYMLHFLCCSGYPKSEIVTCLSPSAIVVTEAGCKWFEEHSVRPFDTYVSKLTVPQSSVAVRLVKYGVGTAMVFHNNTCLYPTLWDDDFADEGSVMERSPDTSRLANNFLDELLSATKKIKPSSILANLGAQDTFIMYQQLVTNMPKTQQMMCFHDAPDMSKPDLLSSYFKPSVEKYKSTIQLRQDDVLKTITAYELLIKPRSYTNKTIREGLVKLLTKELLH